MAEELTFPASPEIAPVENIPPKNLIRDIIGIVHDPANTFKRVLSIGYWIGILLVIMLAAGALEQVFHNQAVNLAIEKMTEKAGENAVQMQPMIDFYQGAWARPLYFIFTALGQVVYLLIVAVLYFFIGSVIFGGTAKFKQVWIVSCWSYIIILIDILIKTPLILAKDNVEAGINFGLIFTEGMVGTKLHNAFNAIDLFGMWHFIVAGIGLAIVYKFSSKKGIGIACTVWVLMTLVGFITGYLS